MTEYVRIKSGGITARMLNRDKNNYVDLMRVDEGRTPPGEGWYPVEKVLPKPTPGPGQLLGYTYTIENGVAKKRYFVEAPTQVDMSQVKNFDQLKAVVASLVGSAMALLFSALPASGQTQFRYIDETNTLYTASETDTAITNYYALSSTGRVAIDTNGVLAVDLRNTPTNDWTRAWDSAALKAALDANTAALTAAQAALARAVAAWADFDAQGRENPDADIITLNRAYTAIGSGFFWASSGGYHCLCSDGAVAYLAVTNGSLRIFGNSISNYFGLMAGGTVTVGADASGFRVQNGVASITYPYTGGDYPAVWGAATVAGPWTEMTSAVWVTDSGAGTATASFPADQTSFFFKATTTRELSEYFHATVPAYLEGGVKVAADDLSPVVYDSKVTIQSGGHTYRIPAEIVQ